MNNVVITGATSMVGVHLLQQFNTFEYEIYAVVRPGSKNLERLKQFTHLKIINCEIADMEKLNEMLPERIDVFYHLAWEGARRPYRDNKILQKNNYLAALKVYEVAKNKKCNKFIGVGSQAEYGKTVGVITEDYPTHPTTMYGKYKLLAGKELLQAGAVDNMNVIWPRIFSVYGRYDNSETLIMTALEKFTKDERMDLTECKQNWNYLFVRDIGKMLYLLGTQNCESGVYNFASQDNRPLYEYVTELRNILHSNSMLAFGAVPYGAEGVVSFQPDITKFMKNFPSFSFESFKNGIQEMLRYEEL